MQSTAAWARFPAPSEFAVRNLIYCDAMGRPSRPQFLINRYYFNNYLVMHVIYGILVVEQYGQVFRLQPGQTVLMSLKDPHKYYFEKGCPSQISWFHFNGTPAELLMDSLKMEQLLPYIAELPEIRERIEGLYRIGSGDAPGREMEIASRIYGILLDMVGPCLEQLQQAYGREPPFRREMARYIHASLDRNPTLEELAQQAHMSRSRFCAVFKNTFGMTPGAYIQQEKIRTAKRLLLCTDETICQISNILAFHDQSYFTNVFRRVTGVTPRAYRMCNGRDASEKI